MVRYEIRSHKKGTPDEIAALERAFMRMLGTAPALRGIEVRGHNGHLQIRMDLEGPVEHARRNGEQAFSRAWYDAFGEPGSAHLGWIAEAPAALPPPAVARPRQRTRERDGR